MWGQLFFSVPSIGSRLISSLTRTSNYFYPVGGLPTYPFTILHTHSLVLLSSMHHLPTFFIIAYIVPPSSEDFFFAAIVHFSTLSFILSPTLLWVLVSSSWSRSEYNHRHSFPSCIITPYLSCCHTPRRYLQPPLYANTTILRRAWPPGILFLRPLQLIARIISFHTTVDRFANIIPQRAVCASQNLYCIVYR